MGVSNFDVIQANAIIGGGIITYSPFATHFFVDSVNGSDGNDGRGPSSAVATINQAVVLATAARGDIINVAPGHTETISTATALVLNKSNIQIIGHGSYRSRPVVTLAGAATTKIPVSAAGILIRNIRFDANFADIATVFLLTTAQGFTVNGCKFKDTSSILNFLTVITTTVAVVADSLNFIGNEVNSLGTTAATTAIKILGTHDILRIKDNVFYRAAISNTPVILAHAALVVTRLDMGQNAVFSPTTDTSTGGILISTTSTTNTGLVYDNRIKCLDVAGMLLCTTGSAYGFIENYICGTADASGIIIPAADSDGS